MERNDIVNDTQTLRGILSAHGLKVTPQRLAIFRVLRECHEHPTAERVSELIEPVLPGISLATVYKTLDSLVAAGLARKVKSGDDVLRFDAKLENHGHVYCSNTSQIFDFEDPELEALLTNYFAKKQFTNFRLTDFQVQINGEILDPQQHVKIS